MDSELHVNLQAPFHRSEMKGAEKEMATWEEEGENSHPSLAVKTYYLGEPINRKSFQSACVSLHKGLHRMKGIVQFEDKKGLHLIQYAYNELEMMHIRPQKTVQEVLVVIGELEALSMFNETLLDLIGF
ncbi:GTP-binding protein [Cohnella cholangitidis]|uniref:GTP-binding protein n=1 Tax=Cohnella cholangitidis TaxID=2598458 RepID=A0A7G5C6B0_9BACL|nr:GTP-binding protein [Cohnella cholangitidis]